MVTCHPRASPPIAATTRSHHHAGQQSGSSPAAGTDYAIRLSECFPVGAFLRRLNKRKNRSVAITALVRKLVTIVFLLLKSNKSYRYANPDLMRQKFTKLEVLPKRSKVGSDLDAIYRATGLPWVTTPDHPPQVERQCPTSASWKSSWPGCTNHSTRSLNRKVNRAVFRDGTACLPFRYPDLGHCAWATPSGFLEARLQCPKGRKQSDP